MGIFNSINISSTGLTAERTRMDIISKNIANSTTTRTSSGTPYRRKMVVFEENSSRSFSSYLNESSKKMIESKGVKISKIVEDKTSFKRIYEPGHPDADKDGYVMMPNVDVIKEMVDMITASRAYEANITAINSSKSINMKALDIGR